MDEPGAGGAFHEYEILPVAASEDLKRPPFATISFQKGPVQEFGKNGIFMEDLLQICRHRLKCFQDGEFACQENGMALQNIEDALAWLNKRTRDRQARGVEGTSDK